MNPTWLRGSQVKLLKHWLNTLMGLKPPLKEDARLDAETQAAVRSFKQTYGLSPVDGDVDALTLATLGTQLGWRAEKGIEAADAKLTQSGLTGKLPIDIDTFIRHY